MQFFPGLKKRNSVLSELIIIKLKILHEIGERIESENNQKKEHEHR